MNLHVLTINIAQQPIRIFTGLKNRNKRAQRLVQTIKQLDPLPDIICFQELFRKKSQKIIIEGLKNIYPYYNVDKTCGKYIIGVNSGLAIFSKYPIEEKMFHQYTKEKGVENFAKKGILGLKLKLDDDDLFVFTTHLQTGLGAEPCICKCFDNNKLSSDDLKKIQVQEAVNKIKEFTKNDNSPSIIFTGDFNTPSVNDLYQIESHLLNSIDLEDIFNKQKSPLDTTVIGKPDRRIDYIWTNILGSNDIVTTKFGNIVGYITDHYGVIGELSLNNKSKTKIL